MPDDAPAAPARPPQQPTAAQLDELEKLSADLMDRSGTAAEEDAQFYQGAAEAIDALIADCRAAGAATPPAEAMDKECAVAFLRTKGPMPGLIGYDSAEWFAARKTFYAGWDARGALAAGAGAATPALTAEDRAHVERVRVKCNSGQPINATLLLLGVIDRITAGGVAAAPSPAAPPKLSERRAWFVYEAARLAAIAAKAPIIPEPWGERDKAFRSQFVDVIDRQCGPERKASPSELHDDWVKAYEAMGWVYGPERDVAQRIHPDMVPYEELGQLERDKDAVFVALCEIARQWVYELPLAPGPQREEPTPP